jgi:integrase
MKARQVTVRGELCWVVPLGKRHVGKRIRVFGSTKENALLRAEERLLELREHGKSLATISTDHRSLIIDWRDKLTVDQMREAFSRYSEARCESPTVEQAVEDYITANKLQKRTRTTAPDDARFSRQHAADIRYRLGKFEAAFAGRRMDSIIPGELETFFADQGASARNFYKVLHTVFGYARRHRWITFDPFAEVKPPAKNAKGSKEIFKPGEMKLLLRAAAGMIDGCDRHESTLALLVLGGQCGLRYSEALRLRWDHVDLPGRRIHLDGLKTSKRGLRERFVKILPAPAAWLGSIARDESGRVVQVNDKNARIHRSRVLKAAKLKAWPHNALRRSFGSYHYEAFENIELTAKEMGHTSGDTTISKYRTLANKEDGEAWFALSPDVVAETRNVVPFPAAISG